MTDSINLGQKRLHQTDNSSAEPTLKRTKYEPALSQTTTCTPVSLEPLPVDKQEIALQILQSLIEEFNCNHQTFQDSATVNIFTRDAEEQQINTFIDDNLRKGKSGLMYLCGHPGTGKTSLLNQVLAKLKQQH